MASVDKTSAPCRAALNEIINALAETTGKSRKEIACSIVNREVFEQGAKASKYHVDFSRKKTEVSLL
ncbi:hypothetical protein V5H05_09370 [Vibrio cholerae]|uniref:hypothetical protein n=1 Tax=Vibrio cholerae TaxID=666 RepID=UPI003966A935